MKAIDKDTLILVTGGTGMVGSYLIRYLLQQGYTRVRALCRANSRFDLLGSIRDQVEWVVTDVLDIVGLEEAMNNVQQVYHCAAMISFDARERELMLKTNRDGTANIINAGLDAGIEKLVHVSSIAAIGRDRKKNEVTEQTKWQKGPNNTYYGISKFQGEQEVWRGQAEGLKVAVVNPSVILGGGFWDNGPLQLFGMVWKAFRFFPVGINGFVDVRDVARFMIRLMESDIDGERYILNADNSSYRQLQTDIAAALDRPPPRYPLSLALAIWAGRLEWIRAKITGKAPLITKETARLTSLSYIYENEKSRRDLRFDYIPLEETIRETAALFKEAAHDGFSPKILPLK